MIDIQMWGKLLHGEYYTGYSAEAVLLDNFVMEHYTFIFYLVY